MEATIIIYLIFNRGAICSQDYVDRIFNDIIVNNYAVIFL
jgi:hypothetical protein